MGWSEITKTNGHCNGKSTKANYGATLGTPLNPWWGGVGPWGPNPMHPQPQRAHQGWHAMAGGGWVPHWWPKPGFGGAQPGPPFSPIQWAPQLVAPNGPPTLMAMA